MRDDAGAQSLSAREFGSKKRSVRSAFAAYHLGASTLTETSCADLDRTVAIESATL